MTRWMSLTVLAALMLTACGTIIWPWQRPATPVADLSPGAEVPPASQPGLALASDQRFKDVPLPIKVTEDKERSYIYDSKEIQIGRMVYTTRAGMNELGEFYLREAPAAGWKLDRVLEAGNKDLFFSKPGKRLTVTIRDLGIAKGRQLILNYAPDAGSGL